MSVLDDLLAEGLIEAVESDLSTASQWIEDARRHVEAARAIVSIDPSGAYVLAYDAARKSVAAVLAITGHRVLSRPGSHQAIARFAESLSEETGQPAFDYLDRMRRNRNRSEYSSRTFGAAEVEEAIRLAGLMTEVCSQRLR